LAGTRKNGGEASDLSMFLGGEKKGRGVSTWLRILLLSNPRNKGGEKKRGRGKREDGGGGL